ncbi:MAG: hypothetical protein AB8B78_03720 [Polaribacter sp.]
MKNNYSNFKKPIEAIINSNTIDKEIITVNILVDTYNKLCEDLFLDDLIEENKKTTINGGIALSSKHAKDCLEDPIRTARFLKGVYKALLVAKERFKNEKITILYAGCGPLGPLIVPLLHLFSPDEIEIVLLDIHQNSIDSVKKIITELKYKAYIKEYIVADATIFVYPKDKPLHIIITETMDKALTKEPQVEITRNLGKQLIDDGIFIPKKIEIKKGYSFFAKEVIFNLNDGFSKLIQKKQQEEKSNSTNLFSITNKIDSLNSFSFETDWISVPSDYEETPDICLYTSLQIFDNIYINESESYITNPFCVKSLYNIKDKKYKLQYSTIGIPNWKVLQ